MSAFVTVRLQPVEASECLDRGDSPHSVVGVCRSITVRTDSQELTVPSSHSSKGIRILRYQFLIFKNLKIKLNMQMIIYEQFHSPFPARSMDKAFLP